MLKEWFLKLSTDFSLWELSLTALGALLAFAFKTIWKYFQSSKGEFTGTWKQTIPPYQSEPEKIATVKVKHIGDKIICTTLRTSPKLQFDQAWKVEGRIKRGLIFGIYWPKDSSKLPGSYGTLQFHIIDENLFDGYYVRANAQKVNASGQFVEKLNFIPIKWERVHT
jgi:hypothetical protein